MIKTIKGKVVAGTVAVTLFAGSGVAFGYTDAGTKLKTWYDNQFGLKVSEINTAQKVNDLKGTLTTSYGDRIAVATSRIATTRDVEMAAKKDSIETQANKHIKDVGDKKEEISGYMASEFVKLFNEANASINQAGSEALEYADVNLPKDTKTLGDNAISVLNTELKMTTEQAVTDLTAAIAAAKGSLQTQLNSESAATKAEIIAAIDAKAVQVRKYIVDLRNSLVDAQQKLIVDEAKRLEQVAKDDMQGLVDGI